MAADDDTQETVRRILQKRPPAPLPPGADDRLRQRLDREPPPQRARRKTAASIGKPRKKATKARKTSTRRRR